MKQPFLVLLVKDIKGLPMVTKKPRIKFTYIDYKNTPEDKRYELLDGELVVVPSPRTGHQKTLLNLGI